jgi:molybdenum cofactor sulfurtransferase
VHHAQSSFRLKQLLTTTLGAQKYFGGGTISLVNIFGEAFHRSKGLQAPAYSLHEGLEDGTLPFHSIIALGEAIDVHKRLYGSMSTISAHTTYLICRIFRGLAELRHSNGRPVCQIYNENGAAFEDPSSQGSAIAFNVLKADGQYVPYNEVEKSANDVGIYLRSGGSIKPCLKS